MSDFRYEVHVVTGSEYDRTRLGGQYVGGLVIQKFRGMREDWIFVIAIGVTLSKVLLVSEKVLRD